MNGSSATASGTFRDWLAHEHDDGYWKTLDRRRNAPYMPAKVHLATGWYDIFLASTLADYEALRKAGRTVRLMIGPWYHGRGVIDRDYRADRDRWLATAQRDSAPAGTPVRIYLGGADEWRDLTDWPPPQHQASVWYLHPGGALATDRPPLSPPDRYRYDPADPTPAVGGAVENFDGTAGAKDNRKLEQRADVLTYTSDVLADDVEVIGPVRASIAFRSTVERTDVHARLCDVHPDGRSVNLCDGARRLGPEQPTAAEGTRVVELDLVAVGHRFRAGHRIRLQVSSGAHPRLIRNTGTDEPLASATHLRTAEQEVLHDPSHLSTLTLPGPAP